VPLRELARLEALGDRPGIAASYLVHGDPQQALARTASSVFDLLVNTLDSGGRELQLVESQAAYAAPRMQFEVERLR
jgi:pyridoxine kinase